MHLNHLNLNLNHSISKEEKKSDKSDKSQAEMSDKFQALLTQLKAGAMVPHWTSIGKHTNRVWLQRLENQVFQSSRSPWSFFVSKTVALSQNCWQQAWGCLWSSHACTLFSEPKKDNKPVGPAPTSCMQAQTSFPLAGLHMQALLILYIICPNQEVSRKEPQHCSSLPCVAWKCDSP